MSRNAGLPSFFTTDAARHPTCLTGTWAPHGHEQAAAAVALELEAVGSEGVRVFVDQVRGGNRALVHLESDAVQAVGGQLALLEDLAHRATPGPHLLRVGKLSSAIRKRMAGNDVPVVAGEFLFGWQRDAAGDDAVHVTAQWTCKPGAPIEELIQCWQEVGKDAHALEQGLLAFEVYRVVGQDALLIHEVFQDSRELKVHLTKGTAAIHKKRIDAVASPTCYYFRGPVSWLIRTFSKFMRLPATYTTATKS